MTRVDDKHPIVWREPTPLQTELLEWRRQGRTIGLVPTMGALHEGHLSLVRAARQSCDLVVATIFVNPTQFGPHEDFQKYPRTLTADLDLLAAEQTYGVFVPDREVMYPPGCSTFVEPGTVAALWEGTCRPGHFRGVATIVMKLFHLIPATVAFFGQKDFQQCRVIEQMVRDLNVPIEIRRCPIVRETDGLAMSSRNRYLSPADRTRAAAVSRALRTGQEQCAAGERRVAVLRDAMLKVLHQAEIRDVDYLTVADPETLAELHSVETTSVILAAVRVGSTRLIDNCLIAPPAGIGREGS